MRRADIVIVGAGPAGVAAAVQCRRLGVTPLLIDERGRAGGLIENARAIENYPGLEEPVDGLEFAGRLRRQLGRCDIEVAGERISGLSREGAAYRLRGEGGDVEARALVLAVGTTPRRLGLAGEDEAGAGQRLFYEVRLLLERWARPRLAIVVGAGEAACDQSLTLVERGAEVALAVRGCRLKACGRLLDLVSREKRIRVMWETEIVGLEAGAATAWGVTARERTGRLATIGGDALLVAVGRESAAGPLLDRSGVDGGGADLARAPGLWLVGDARSGKLGQTAMAVGDGLHAAGLAVDWLRSV